MCQFIVQLSTMSQLLKKKKGALKTVHIYNIWHVVGLQVRSSNTNNNH